jgi:hypothetical protein
MPKLSIAPGSTSQTVNVFIQDSSVTTNVAGRTGLVFNTASLTCYYARTRGASTAVTLATLASATAAWATGGFIEIDATNQPGMYRLDLPDAVLASGVRSAVVYLRGASNMVPCILEIDLDAEVDIRQVAGQTASAAGAVTFPGTIASTTNITAGTITTVTTTTTATNLTNLPTIPANWLTAAGIAASALNGKGDWNVGKTGYALTATTGLGNQTANITGTITTATNLTNLPSIPANWLTAAGIATGAITAAKFAAGAIDAAAIATDAIDGDALAASAGTEIGTAVWATAARTLTAGTNIALAKGTGITGFNDLDAAGVATAVWNAATATYGSAGSYGLLVETNLDAAVSTASAPSAATVADAVWDEVLSGHLTGGSTGNALNAAGSAGDPWSTSLPGAYSAGSAGHIIGNRIDAAITSRLAPTVASRTLDVTATGAAGIDWANVEGQGTSVTLTNTAINAFLATGEAAIVAGNVWTNATRTLSAGTNIVLAKGTGITGFTDLDAAGVRTAVGLASANLDTQLTAIDDYLDTEIAAIKAKTDNLPAAPAATGDIPTTAQIADKVLGRNLAGGSDGGRTVQDALRFSRNRWTLSGGVLTVYAENDSTVAWTSAVTTNAAADPVTGSDPA